MQACIVDVLAEKRKSQQQTRQAYKWLKRVESEEEKHGTVKDLLNGEGKSQIFILHQSSIKPAS